MRNLTNLFFVFFALFGCSQLDVSEKYSPNLLLGKSQQDSLTYSLIRYIGRLPKYASDSSKFDIKFDSAYFQIAKQHNLMALYKKGDSIYFMYTRIAPSLEEKYVAIGGLVAFNGSEISYYEEIFRTWKKRRDELTPISYKLFDEMVQGKDLSIYYPENSGDEYIIEFPSKDVIFDKETRIWKRIPTTK
jgi:hypothetical protein